MFLIYKLFLNHIAGIAGSNTAAGMDVCLLWMSRVVQLEVFAVGRSRAQRSPSECGMSKCDVETSTMLRPWSTRGYCTKIR